MTNPVKDVWASDLDSAFSEIEEAVFGCHCCCMAMDTEFPGSLYGNSHQLPKEPEQFSNYELLKMNVDSTHLIQLGLSFCEVTENGEFGDESSWQFTFKEFKEEDHSHNTTYVAFLKKPGDNLLVKNRLDGIESNKFKKKLMESSLLSNPKIKWVTFHGNSDIGYLIKMLSIGRVLPLNVNEFKGMMNSIFCGGVIDLRYMVNGLSDFPIKALKDIVNSMKVQLDGISLHRAGHGSLLTLKLFKRFKQTGYYNSNSMKKMEGFIFGLDD